MIHKGVFVYACANGACHLSRRRHDSDFYKLLGRCLPDWVQRKQKLERALV